MEDSEVKINSRDLPLVLSTFQPYTNRHKYLVDWGMRHCGRVVCCILGWDKPRTWREPWNGIERVDMITSNHVSDGPRVQVVGINDFPTDEVWLGSIIHKVHGWLPVDPNNRPLGGQYAILNGPAVADQLPNSYRLQVPSPSFRSQLEITEDFFKHRWAFESHVEGDVPVSTLGRMQEFHGAPIYVDLRTQYLGAGL